MTWVKAGNKIYKCDGTDDEVQLQAAVDVLPSLGGRIKLSPGTFYGRFVLPHSTTNRSIVVSGAGKFATRIVGTADSAGAGIIDTAQDHMVVGGYPVLVENLSVIGSGNGEKYGIHLLDHQVSMRHVLVEGKFDGVSPTMIYLGGSSDNGCPKILEDVIAHTSSTTSNTMVDCIMVQGENYYLASVFVSVEYSDVTDCFHLAGTGSAAGCLGVYLGNTRHILGSCVHVASGNHYDIGHLMLTQSATPHAWGNVFECTGTATLHVGKLSDGFTGGTVFADATTLAQCKCEMGYGSYLMNNRGTSAVASGQTHVHVTHGVCYTPSADEIYITPTAKSTADPTFYWWVDGITDTEFVVNVAVDPGVLTFPFAWAVRKGVVC